MNRWMLIIYTVIFILAVGKISLGDEVKKEEQAGEVKAFPIVGTQLLAQFHPDTGTFEFSKNVKCEDVLKAKLYEAESLKQEIAHLKEVKPQAKKTKPQVDRD